MSTRVETITTHGVTFTVRTTPNSPIMLEPGEKRVGPSTETSRELFIGHRRIGRLYVDEAGRSGASTTRWTFTPDALGVRPIRRGNQTRAALLDAVALEVVPRLVSSSEATP